MRGLISVVEEIGDKLVYADFVFAVTPRKGGEKIVRVFSRVSCDTLNFGEGRATQSKQKQQQNTK